MGSFTASRRTLFLAFVGVGMLSGLLMGSLGSALAAEVASVKTPAKQSSVVVVVDALDSPQPVLLAAWHVQQTHSGALEWTPLYPASLQNETMYAHPHADLRLAGTDSEAIATAEPIAKAAISFDELFVLDQNAVAAISTLAGNLLTLRPAAAEPQAALQEQVQLVQGLCAAQWEADYLDAWVALMPGHLQSSTSMFELITRWDAWAQAGFGLHCSHPWAEAS